VIRKKERKRKKKEDVSCEFDSERERDDGTTDNECKIELIPKVGQNNDSLATPVHLLSLFHFTFSDANFFIVVLRLATNRSARLVPCLTFN